jgi:hypothetical protein
VAGCWFDSKFNLYTADFDDTKVIKHDLAIDSQTGLRTQSLFANTQTDAPDGHSNSIVMAVNGAVYVGQGAGSPVQPELLSYRSDGTFLDSDTPDIETGGGIDWMDLATDQRTMFYTSRGRAIKRYNVETDTQLGDFVTLPVETVGNTSAKAFAIRLLGPSFNGSHGLLVADNLNIKRLDAAGTVVATFDYTASNANNSENAWQGLNLDPDGLHFWAAGVSKGTRLYRFPLASSGTDLAPNLGPIDAGGNNTRTGVCILGEPQTQVFSLNLSTPPGPSQFFDVTAKFGDPAALGTGDPYSFNIYRLQINVKGNQSVVGAVSFTPESTSLACTGSTDESPFDCRFTQTPAQCVPYFNDPDPPNPTGSLDPYRCGFYRLEIPSCTAANASSCPYADPFIPGTDDINFQFIIDHPDAPPSFNVMAFGPPPKGNPRLMRDPSRVTGDQFFIDATAAVIDPPYFGGGGVNDYAVAQRVPINPGACATVINPNDKGLNSGSSIKITIEVKSGPMVGTVCTGTPLGGATDGTNKITLAIAGTGTNNTLIIYCTTPGNSNACFQPNGPTGTYQANVNLDPASIPPDTVNPYFFAVTSVNVPSDNTGTQNAGIFPPTGRTYFVCPNGSNCGG